MTETQLDEFDPVAERVRQQLRTFPLKFRELGEGGKLSQILTDGETWNDVVARVLKHVDEDAALRDCDPHVKDERSSVPGDSGPDESEWMSRSRDDADGVIPPAVCRSKWRHPIVSRRRSADQNHG